MSTESEGYLSFGVGLIFGMGLGAAIGLLVAPKSGQELRSELNQLAHEFPQSFNTNLDDTKEVCHGYIDKVRYTIEKQIRQVGEAFKAGRMAAAKKREQLEEDLAEY